MENVFGLGISHLHKIHTYAIFVCYTQNFTFTSSSYTKQAMAENSSLNCHGQDQDDDFVVVHSSPQSNGNFTNLVDICACDVCKDSNVAVSCCTSCAELLCKLCTEHHMKYVVVFNIDFWQKVHQTTGIALIIC